MRHTSTRAHTRPHTHNTRNTHTQHARPAAFTCSNQRTCTHERVRVITGSQTTPLAKHKQHTQTMQRTSRQFPASPKHGHCCALLHVKNVIFPRQIGLKNRAGSIPFGGGTPWGLGVFWGGRGGGTDFPLAAVCCRPPRRATPGCLTGGGKPLASRRKAQASSLLS